MLVKEAILPVAVATAEPAKAETSKHDTAVREYAEVLFLFAQASGYYEFTLEDAKQVPLDVLAVVVTQMQEAHAAMQTESKDELPNLYLPVFDENDFVTAATAWALARMTVNSSLTSSPEKFKQLNDQRRRLQN